MTFSDRNQAGKLLAKKLKHMLNKDDRPVVYALVRGGVVVGYEVASALHAQFDIVLVRKIGYPGYEEYAIGAIAENDEPVLNELEVANVDDSYLAETIQHEREVIAHRQELYLGESKRISAHGKTAIVVDDGIATGLTMMAAIQYLNGQNPKRIIVAVPVSSKEAVQDLQPIVDDIVLLERPKQFRGSIGAHYQEFAQVTDDEVVVLLNETRPKT